MAAKEFLMGNEVLARAARVAGARAIFGYPITPTTEILQWWAKEATTKLGKRDNIVFLQAEDEIAAGFMLIGSVLGGTRAFTATAGPGNVLMQDAFSMAEAMRIPTVAYIMQRGGPSTSTVIYSQQEVNLTCYGGNGNGYRLVYAPSNLQELYDYGIKVFDIAWRHRFPTFLLGDGYLAKMMGEVELYSLEERGITIAPTEAYVAEIQRTVPIADVVPTPEFEIRVDDGTEYACYRNCLNLEEETLMVNTELKAAFDKIAPMLVEHEDYGPKDAETLIVAYGIVGAGAKTAVDRLEGAARLFRPITLRPFPDEGLRRAAKGAKRILVVESAQSQLSRIVRDTLYGYASAPVHEYCRPSIGIVPHEIVEAVKAL